MPKGEVPVPYIIALILALIIIAVIAYMFFTHTGIFSGTANAAWCEGKKAEYCFRWAQKSSDYSEPSKAPGTWDTFAPGCTQVGIVADSETCQLV